MLPVCLFNLGEPQQQTLLDSLARSAGQHGVPIQANPASARQAQQAADAPEPTLFMLGVSKLQPGGDLTALKLSRLIVRASREHYVVLVLESASDLEDVLSVCTQLAGVLCLPLVDKRAQNIFRLVFQDFLARGQKDTGPEDKRVIPLKAGNTVHRLKAGAILCVQALDKKIEVATTTQTLQLYANMEDILERLGEGFQRCHRSYIVNQAHISSIDWTGMAITLSNGAQVPLSRGYRAALKEVFPQ